MQPHNSTVFEIRLLPGDVPFPAPAEQTVLLSAHIAGYPLLSSCRNGTCRTCLCKLQSGTVTYRIPWPGLSVEEKAEGYILPCVAYPDSDLVLDSFI